MGLQDLTPQLRTRLGRVEWYVGLFLGATALLMVLAFGLYLRRTADARGWFVVDVPYFTYLPDASGLRVGSSVNLMGFKVGEVTEVTAVSFDERRAWDYLATNGHRVFVGFRIRSDKRSNFPGYVNSDARVRIAGFPVELMGGTALEVQEGRPDGVATFGVTRDGKPGVLDKDFAFTAPGPDRTNKFKRYEPVKEAKGYFLKLDQAETMAAQAQRVVERLDRIAATVDSRLPTMLSEIQQTLEVTRAALPGITNQVGQVLETARLTLPGLTNNLDAVLANTRDLTAQLRETWPMLTNTLELTLLASRQLVTNINGAIPTLASNVNVTLTNVNVLLARDTNVTANASALVSNVNHVITRHWLFRSAFKEKAPQPPASNRPAPRRGVRSPRASASGAP
jgi:ABC-type transporter Mla subunit MlaD